MDDFELLCESLVSGEVLDIKVILTCVFGIDMIKLENNVHKTAIDKLGLLAKVWIRLGGSKKISHEYLKGYDTVSHTKSLIPHIEFEALLHEFLSFNLSSSHDIVLRGRLSLCFLLTILCWFLCCEFFGTLINKELLDLEAELRNLLDVTLKK